MYSPYVQANKITIARISIVDFEGLLDGIFTRRDAFFCHQYRKNTSLLVKASLIPLKSESMLLIAAWTPATRWAASPSALTISPSESPSNFPAAVAAEKTPKTVIGEKGKSSSTFPLMQDAGPIPRSLPTLRP